MRRNIGWIIASLLWVWVGTAAVGAEEARLLRFADIHEDRIAFVHAGDIWIVPAAGGTARRLTSDEGLELFPKFSPDGRWIAYSAEYGGNRQVWVIAVDGGTPRQLTFYNDVGPMPPRGGFDYQVLDWTPDGKHVLFRANRLPWGVRMGRPYLVPFEGGMERPLAVPESGGGMLSPDGKKLVYTPISREFRTWKRYRGGRAQDIWIYDLEADTAEPITEYDGTDNQPVWVGNTIYYTSDREDGRLNLWAHDLATGAARRVTEHRDFDVLWPSAGPRQVVYECGGQLYRFDPATSRSTRVPVQLTGDFLAALPAYRKVAGFVSGYDISPSGKRAVFAARGDLFTVPEQKGDTRNITRTDGVREMSPAWSPDGRHVAYLSDRSGEYELYLRAQDGSGEERRLTSGGAVWKSTPVWSPDGKKLAWADRTPRLRYLEVDTEQVLDVDTGVYGTFQSYRWSPDSRFLVYAKVEQTQFSSIFLYSLADRRIDALTDDTTNDFDPVFDPEGRYLYFLSDRDYNLTFSGYEFNYFYTNPTRLYAATLRADAPPLLAAKSDEEQAEQPEPEPKQEPPSSKKKKRAAKAADADEDDSAEKPLVIDVERFGDRVVALPGPSGNYGNLAATKDGVLYLFSTGNGAAQLKLFSLDDEKAQTILKEASAFAVSHDGKKLLYSHAGKYGIVDTKPGHEEGAGQLDLGGLEMKIDPRREWRQIFADGYRIVRDFFYDPGLHGVDWPALRALYEPLVEHVMHRADLDYILGELGGELNAGHFYVNWGDMPRPERRNNGLLGAEIVRDDSGYFRIARIFHGENWHDDFRSPLTESGVDVKQGDLVLAVDGRSTRDVPNFYALLENAAGRLVRLTVNERPERDGARDALVRPIDGETNLRYLDWVRSRRELVDRLSEGRIGYIHLPNTAGPGNRELRKFFYPQAHKDALIVDVRYNGGGFIPDRMIELVARRPLSFWARRGIAPFSTPGYFHDGPKACLINAYAASGGDAFPYYFKQLGLGPLIGKRTWGGLIGLSGNPGFVDGGSISVPTFRFIDTAGNWAVENVGVAPDIEVLDRPDLVARGQDPTLEKAVEVLLEELRRTQGPTRIEVPEAPRYGR